MIRGLCYRHYTTEFDALPNGRRHEASTWVTVAEEECAECKRLAELKPQVKAECLELAMKTLKRDAIRIRVNEVPRRHGDAIDTLAEIEQRLALLGPEEKTE